MRETGSHAGPAFPSEAHRFSARPPVVALAFVPGRTPVPRGFAFLRFHITQQENSVYGRRSGALVQVYSAIDVLIRRNLWNTEARLIRARKKL